MNNRLPEREGHLLEKRRFIFADGEGLVAERAGEGHGGSISGPSDSFC